jgi:hypothetical protein
MNAAWGGTNALGQAFDPEMRKGQAKNAKPAGPIIHFMARGWESKSVEAQQADAAEKSGPHRTPLTPREAARQRELESLRLSRQNLLQQLERAKDPRHRRMLEDAMAEIQRRMEEF